MNDIELADKIIALGIGSQSDTLSCDGVGFYETPNGDGVFSELFVRDWSVAGALMNKLFHTMVISIKTVDSAAWVEIIEYSPNGDEEAQPIRTMAHEEDTAYAINKACVEALS